MMRHLCSAVSLVCMVVPVRVAVAGAETSLDWIVPVVAPGATDLAVNDRLGLLAITAARADAQLTVRPLAAGGDDLVLPRLPAATLPDAANYPTSVVFHPTLPLLYLWQDIRRPEKGSPEFEAIATEFDHLLIYSLADGKLQAEGAFARGQPFTFGREAAAAKIALDPEGTRIYLPNLGGPAAIGYYDLDEHGLPRPVPVPIAGTLDGFGLNKFEMRVEAARVDVQQFQTAATGWGFVAPAADVVLFATKQGLAVWDTASRMAPLAHFVIAASDGQFMLGGETDSPLAFGSERDGGLVFRMAHCGGFPTLLPQSRRIQGAKFQSRPHFIAGRRLLAVGGSNRVHLLGLTDDGHFDGNDLEFPVNGKARALAYSRDRALLYVSVESVP